jgi:hypothetical protein
MAPPRRLYAVDVDALCGATIAATVTRITKAEMREVNKAANGVKSENCYSGQAVSVDLVWMTLKQKDRPKKAVYL